MRAMSPQKKLDKVFEMWETYMDIRIALVKRRYPHLTWEEARKKAVKQVLKIQLEKTEEERRIAEGYYRKQNR